MRRLPRVNVSLRADSVLPGRATDEVVALAFEEDALGGRPFVCAAIDDHVRLMGASLETANRAVYATRQMAEAGYLSQMDFSHAVAEGELYSIVFGDMVCVGFDPETGEDRDITDAEAQRVMDRFGSDESIESGGLELIRTMLRRRAVR